MNAIEYVKKNGIEKSKIHLDRMKQERWINSFFNDLKQIVEAFELVESKGGLVECEKILSRDNFTWCSSGRVYINPLDRAVKIVEQCQ